jgi:ribosomal protein S18 acetylase RimI-like enzyme
MIKQLNECEISFAVEVIRASFATVAEEFGLTEQNSPRYTAFSVNTERLKNQLEWGWLMYGFYDETRLIGYVSLSKESKENEADDIYEIHNLAVLPEYRRKGYGRRLLDFCKEKVKESGGGKIVLGIIEENTVLKNWYAENGFIHTGTKKFDFFPFTSGYMEYV